MPTVELVYDPDCPNVQKAREQLRLALAEAGLPVQWQEWTRADPEAPGYARQYGSPTFLVNGCDVAGVFPAEGANNCRVYPDAQGHLARVPTVEMLTTALSSAKEEVPRAERGETSAKKGWQAMLATIPAASAALLPWGACPACWPAHVGLLSSLGIGVIDYTPIPVALDPGTPGRGPHSPRVPRQSLGLQAFGPGDCGSHDGSVQQVCLLL